LSSKFLERTKKTTKRTAQKRTETKATSHNLPLEIKWTKTRGVQSEANKVEEYVT
jgi:hypothetical protein